MDGETESSVYMGAQNIALEWTEIMNEVYYLSNVQSLINKYLLEYVLLRSERLETPCV